MPDLTHAGGIVRRGDPSAPEYLLVSAKRTGDWVFPKGRIEPGEGPPDAAVREVAEEAGVRATVLARVGSSEFQDGRQAVVVAWFLMRHAGAVAPAERRRTRWCPYEDARVAIQHENLREALDEAHRMPG